MILRVADPASGGAVWRGLAGGTSWHPMLPAGAGVGKGRRDGHPITITDDPNGNWFMIGGF